MNALHLTLAATLLIAASHAVSAATPAERRIAQAMQAIAAKPGLAGPRAALALAYTQRARETSDPAYYDRALVSVEAALALDKTDIQARRVRIWALLGKHEFDAALAAATELNATVPDDYMTYAMLTDANVELGRYADAERSAQWLLDMQPGNATGLTRAAYLRELFGDLTGATELMQQVLQRTAASETEDRAWLLTQLAHLELLQGRPGPAADLAQQALREFPDYHYALAQLADIRLAQGQPQAAVELRRRQVRAAPHAENLYRLALALRSAGQATEAAGILSRFEAAAMAESASADNANRELIAYYNDIAHQPGRALALAERDYARRRDVHTVDSHAWSLHRAGRSREAWLVIRDALAVGVQDPELLRHAGHIAAAVGDDVAAQHHLTRAAALAPWQVDADQLPFRASAN